MKFAIYCRVSTAEQDPENQRLKLVEYAERQGWTYNIYMEKESTRNLRPVKAQLLKSLRMTEYDGLLIWKLSRWARSTIELILELEELYNKGVKIISLSDNIDLSTASGRLQFRMLSAFAEFERELIRDNTILGLARARAQGKALGRPPGRKDKKPRKRSCYKKNEV